MMQNASPGTAVAMPREASCALLLTRVSRRVCLENVVGQTASLLNGHALSPCPLTHLLAERRRGALGCGGCAFCRAPGGGAAPSRSRCRGLLSRPTASGTTRCRDCGSTCPKQTIDGLVQ